MSTKNAQKQKRAELSTASPVSAILRDAARYRFLRALASRDHKHHTTRALEVGIQDWGRNLGSKTSPFWSSLYVTGNEMDRAVDAAMRNDEALRQEPRQ